MRTKLGVLTGGPCAGKTTVTKTIMGEWPEQLVVAPEVATVLLEHLYPTPGQAGFEQWVDSFQEAIFSTQRGAERAQLVEAQQRGKRLVLCDRGTLDAAAYLPGGLAQFVALFGVDVETELRRYDFVIHLESVATAKPGLWEKLKSTNPVRFETEPEAARHEMAIRSVWSGHPCHYFVSGNQSMEAITQQVREILTTHLNTHIERVWRLASLPASLDVSNLSGVSIRQGYLAGGAGTQLRIRQVGGRRFLTIKHRQGVRREKWERALPLAQFEALWPMTKGQRIEKKRFRIPYPDAIWELDVFEGSAEGLILLQVECADQEEADQIKLPEWARGAIEVTHQDSYSNYHLAA